MGRNRTGVRRWWVLALAGRTRVELPSGPLRSAGATVVLGRGPEFQRSRRTAEAGWLVSGLADAGSHVWGISAHGPGCRRDGPMVVRPAHAPASGAPDSLSAPYRRTPHVRLCPGGVSFGAWGG